MRGWYRVLGDASAAEALTELGLQEQFYTAAEELSGDFVFETEPGGDTRVGVKTELGENLLTFAKLRGLLRLKRDRHREEQEL